MYRRIQADVENRIRRGEWPAGFKIPVEHALMRQYGCARATVNKAMTALADAGLIDRRRRLGSFVAQPRIHSAVVEIPDIQAQIAGQGRRYAFRLLSRRRRRPSAGRPRETGLAGAGALLALRGLHLENQRPFALEDRLISLAVVPEAEGADFHAEPPGSWLLEHPTLKQSWTEGEHRISAINVNAEDAALLGIEPHAACLVVERRTWRGEDQITQVRTIFRGDAYDLTERFKPDRSRGSRGSERRRPRRP
jgi:GntR family histidine utilization transcriptional repressor